MGSSRNYPQPVHRLSPSYPESDSEAPPFGQARTARVAEVRRAILAGEYALDPAATAAAMLRKPE